MTDITELAQSLKAAADREMICRDVAETSEIWERTVTPENILVLVEALASEKRICATWRKTAESIGEKLEKAQAAERRWHRVASRVHEQACESDVKIDELEAIRAAAEKLVPRNLQPMFQHRSQCPHPGRVWIAHLWKKAQPLQRQ